MPGGQTGNTRLGEETHVDVDPLELAGEEAEKKGAGQLNTYIAIAVALLATFMAICEVKSGNIEQDMQRAQVEKNDAWAWYQARNIREEVLDTSARTLRAIAASQPESSRGPLLAQAIDDEKKAESQRNKKGEQQETALKYDAEYKLLNVRDDQLDLEAASMSIAISLLAMTALTRKRWLFFVALVPIALGIVMGLAGLFGWAIRTSF
jgi:hypothetical protein